MNLTLSLEIESRIAAEIRSGRFPTPEAVVETAVAELTAGDVDHTLDAADVVAINNAEAQIDRGEGISMDPLRADMAGRLARP